MPPPIGVAQVLLEQHVPVRRVEGEEVALGSRRSRADRRRWASVTRPSACRCRTSRRTFTAVGVDGGDVAEPLALRVLVAERVGGPDERLARLLLERLRAAEFDRRRPVDRGNEEQVQRRRIRRPVPVGPALCAREEPRPSFVSGASTFSIRVTGVLKVPRRGRGSGRKVAILARCGDHLPPAFRREQDRAGGHVPVVVIVLHELAIALQSPVFASSTITPQV